ncbi:hypothetical protein B9Q06_09335 [Candidatus Marsarchaeota G2 archaeon ECH_B_2]|uniref:FAS1 domain-containing protein n=3 Tax=Candidatus Marsarchaeota group 2 TaxID=2203771 RepID=A0A2R6B748_9ARCH|nr:MAG: hypothetical protein B9Q06_09335 [Candidatus Marsarchaeota G2 archaeon ECH_B_2]PSN98827.1 MAG: hypothetical protein B9Q07_08460 [Candidatus Marsarchaeota G2 archaeon ECH_B_3]PSO00829.1 MAG: hypothetical protein B9Q05_09750 [Candidatus Marsarchaeota G2 archaeon ECH_B_1]
MKDIVETAMEAGSFKTLVSAVQAAGLVDALKSPGPFTVFAPNDEAFSKLPAGTVEGLLKDLPKLKSVLTYHVISGKVMSAQAIQLATTQKPARVPTLQGSPVELKLEGLFTKVLYVNNAKVIATDIEATNGVIHVIDSVILPPNM